MAHQMEDESLALSEKPPPSPWPDNIPRRGASASCGSLRQKNSFWDRRTMSQDQGIAVATHRSKALSINARRQLNALQLVCSGVSKIRNEWAKSTSGGSP